MRKKRSHHVRGKGCCGHPLILVAVDRVKFSKSRTVEIWRCPQCEPTGVVPWQVPFLDRGKVFRDAKPGAGDSPGLEDGVRALEDAQE